jgi:hypothetical protein
MVLVTHWSHGTSQPIVNGILSFQSDTIPCLKLSATYAEGVRIRKVVGINSGSAKQPTEFIIVCYANHYLDLTKSERAKHSFSLTLVPFVSRVFGPAKFPFRGSYTLPEDVTGYYVITHRIKQLEEPMSSINNHRISIPVYTIEQQWCQAFQKMKFHYFSYPFPTKWGRYNMFFIMLWYRFGIYFYDRPPAWRQPSLKLEWDCKCSRRQRLSAPSEARRSSI